MKKIDALGFIKQGYSVVPVLNKKPVVGFKNGEIDKRWVLSNWKNDFDIAVVSSGTDWFCVDFDNEQVFERFAPLVSNGFIEKTKRGYHVYFMQPEDEPFTQILPLVAGMDIKGSKNNYVVTHGNLPDIDELPEASEELIDFIRNTEPVQKSSASSIVQIGDTGFMSQPLFNVIRDGWGDVGTHDVTITDFIWMLFAYGASVEAVKYMVALADGATSTSTYRPEELMRKVDNAWKKWGGN
ncbi:bifunctional DNA primase/polymerase [Weissella kandleri]|uniref:bifunctional DNA primase/polymerase n=1 Tax=Weissella kandleri TaxID=1616 RepID=UPI00387E779A